MDYELSYISKVVQHAIGDAFRSFGADRTKSFKDTAGQLRCAANMGRAREAWQSTHKLFSTAVYRKKKFAASQVAPP